MQQLAIPGAYSWSRWQPERGLNFNSHFFVRSGGNVAVDPLELDQGEAEQMAALGGVSWIAITNRDHLRAAASLRSRFNARLMTTRAEAASIDVPVDRILTDDEEFFPGARVVALQNQKTAGEFAVHFYDDRTVVVGDAIIGAPAGTLSLLPDEKYADVSAAALSLRRLLELQPEALLVGDGASLWSGATRAISTLIFDRAGIAANRINVDELRYVRNRENALYDSLDGEVGELIGAERLGYQVVKLPPGTRFCPVHAEFAEEELFIVLDGAPSIRTERETLRCRKGDFIAFPAGPDHAHQAINESASEATLLLLGLNLPVNVVYYPESNKVLAKGPRARWMLRGTPQLDYFDGE